MEREGGTGWRGREVKGVGEAGGTGERGRRTRRGGGGTEERGRGEHRREREEREERLDTEERREGNGSENGGLGWRGMMRCKEEGGVEVGWGTGEGGKGRRAGTRY